MTMVTTNGFGKVHREKTVSAIIPVRNERQYIGQCLESIALADYPKELLEVLVVDGRSDDGTRELILDYAERYPFIRRLDNPNRTVPFAMNLGIRSALGDVIVRIDAHASYGRDYISKLVFYLYELDAENVGGVIVTIPGSDTLEARAVSIILSSPFGVGNSYFRIGSQNVREVDTVPFGCYRREIFDKIGLYDELLTRNQDDELNARLRKSGGKIYLVPDIKIVYIARESIRKMASMFFQYGYFKPLVNAKIGGAASLRQFVPPIFSLLLLLSAGFAVFYPFAFYAFLTVLGSHFAVSVIVSASLAAQNGWRLLPYLLLGFLGAHLSYGIGYLMGVKEFFIFKRYRQKGKARGIGLSG